MANPIRRVRQMIGEQVATLRMSGNALIGGIFPKASRYQGTVVNYDLARQLYRNDGEDYNLGSGFCRRIIDSAVEFVGLPRVSSEDEDRDDFLNTCIHDHWAPALQQMFRDAFRDSKTVVRMHRPDSIFNPLMTADEADHCIIEILEPERVQVVYNPFNAEIIEEAQIEHKISMIDEDVESQRRRDEAPHGHTRSVHSVTEVITPERIRYFDHSEGEWIAALEEPNKFGFVPVQEFFNDWDASLAGGQSDLEASYPFIKAFHDVLAQALQAHGYHSIPKAKFKIHDVMTFLANNFPNSFTEDNGIKTFSGTVDWKGKEILFMQPDEEADFLEAQSILGDSKTLLEFLFDMVCIASETPGWVFMRSEGVSTADKNAESLPFSKKIKRKRINSEPTIQKLCKMALVMNRRTPTHSSINWEAVRPDEDLDMAAVLEKVVMALEVAAQRQLVSDDTYRQVLRRFIPQMKNSKREAADAKKNMPLPEIQAQNQNGQNGDGNPRNIPVSTGQQGKNE